MLPVPLAVPLTMPRLDDRSPVMSPSVWSGVVISMLTMGSMTIGRASRMAARKALRPAVAKAIPATSGPTMPEDGHVLFVNSAYIVGEGTDIFGDVVRTSGRLQAQAAAWLAAVAVSSASSHTTGRRVKRWNAVVFIDVRSGMVGRRMLKSEGTLAKWSLSGYVRRHEI